MGNRLEKLLLACLPDHLAPSPTAAAPAIAGKAPLSSLLHLLPEMCLFPAPFFSLYLAIPYSSPRSQLTLQGLQEAFTCLTQVCAPSPCPKHLVLLFLGIRTHNMEPRLICRQAAFICRVHCYESPSFNMTPIYHKRSINTCGRSD